MKYQVYFTPEALEDFNALRASERAKVKEVMRNTLSSEPTKTSKSRIKRLRGLSKPQYRLRIDDIRVFYDVQYEESEVGAVEVLAIISKEEANEWLARAGVGYETDSVD